LAILCVLNNSAVAQRTSGISPLVTIESGIIEGTTNSKGDITIFRGIPFAAPPVGNLRWKAPQPVAKWKGAKKCVAFTASPMQPIPELNPQSPWSPEFYVPKEPIGEDCLHLNVWSGAKSATEKLPVLVFIYGGGFTGGGTACPIYDGEAIAKKKVIFVSVNYRVGVFGLLAHPELSLESDYGSSGNYALLDVIAALRWVQKNIAAFGGNPKNITVAGHSAGAFIINFLSGSPLAKGLFQRAIAESGGKFYDTPFWGKMIDKKAAEEQGVNFAASLNCSSVAELRAKSADEIAKGNYGISEPILDGHSITESMFDIYKKGRQNDVSILVGWNKDEVSLPQPVKAEVFREQIQKRFGDLSGEFFKVYPSQTDKEATQSQSDIMTDEIFGIQCYTWAKMQTRTGKSRVFVYNFNRPLPAYTPETQFGAFHSGEIVYAYNNLNTLHRPWERIDHTIADRMSNYWANFAKTGNPNGKGLPKWEAYDVLNEKVMLIDKVIALKSLPSRKRMLFWEKYYATINNDKK